ncbi:MAG: hypothetical protein ABIG11_01300, partial [bacterium]
MMKKVETGKTVKAAGTRRLIRLLFFSFTLSTLSPLPSPLLLHAAVPVKFTYQGNIRQSGARVIGNRSMAFRIYSSSDGAVPLWTGPALSVAVSTGVFRVDLEPAGLDWESGSLWLELEVEGVKLSPREELTASPYAINSLYHSGKRYATSAAAPASPVLGDLWLDSNVNMLKFWDGATWMPASSAAPASHAITHAAGGGDPITSLGAYTVTGNVTFNAGTSIGVGAGSAGLAVSTNIIAAGSVTGTLFSGSGAGLTGLVPGNISAGFLPADVIASSIAVGAISASGQIADGIILGQDIANSTITLGKLNQSGCALNEIPKWDGTNWVCSNMAVSGDNLGSHVATTTLQMGAYGVNTSSDITAARYQIAGSTVLAILPGIGSMGVGVNAGSVNTGTYNVFVGSAAGYSNTTGGANIAVGYKAFYSNTTGGQNTALGYFALNSNTGSYDNTAVGFAALTNNTGQYNTGLGFRAGWGNTSGTPNTYIGFDSGFYNQTGTNNTIIGYYAGGKGAGAANSFSYNTITGDSAGYNLTTGGNNIIFGYQAGYGLMTGSSNTFVGTGAGQSVTSGGSNIIIGYGQDAPAAGTSNFLNIGGVLYGDMSAKTIGISTRIPQAALDVVSTGTAADQMAQIWRDSAGVTVGSMSATGVMTAVKFVGDGSGISGLTGVADNLGSHVATTTLNMANKQVIDVSSLGIGTTNPAGFAKLHIAATNPRILLQETDASADNKYWGINPASEKLSFGILDDALTSEMDFLSVERTGWNVIDSVTFPWGKVGIGTTNPGARLDIQETSPSSAYSLRVGTSAAAYHLIVSTTGNVGIGTTSPTSRFHVASPAAVNVAVIESNDTVNGLGTSLFIHNNTGGAGGASSIRLARDSSTKWAWVNDFAKDATDKLTLWQSGGVSRLTVDTGGNIGISSATPSYRLVVSSGAGYSGNMFVISTGTSNMIRMTGLGEIYASKFIGDISGASGLPAGDNLGNHVATTTLNMAGFQINNVSTITVLDGSVVIVPPGTGGSNYTYGISIGSNTYNNYNSGIGVGRNAYNNYQYGVGVGESAYNNYGVGVGVGNNASNNYSGGVGVGINAFNNYNYGVGVGVNTYNNRQYGVGVGAYSQNNSYYGTGVGAYTSSKSSAAALGYYARANQVDSLALGAGANANAMRSVCIGAYCVNNATDTAKIREGYTLNVDSINMSAVLPRLTISTNVFIVGYSSAAKYFGDGSGLTGISGDNLGSHVATTTLNMATFDIIGVSTITVSSITTAAAGVTFSTNVFVTQGNVGIGTT